MQTSHTQSRNRCASTSPLTGLWSVTDCSTRLPSACRSSVSPYNWTLTPNSISYSSSESACEDIPGYVFAAPRTALENSYLTSAMRRGEDGGKERGRVWIDLNAMDAEGCWVSGGAAAPCPYGTGTGYESELQRRTILVSLQPLLCHMICPSNEDVGNLSTVARYISRMTCAEMSVYLGAYDRSCHCIDHNCLDCFC